MACEANFFKKGEERARELGRKGGTAAQTPEVKAKRQATYKKKREYKETMKMLLDLQVGDGDIVTPEEVQSFIEISAPGANVDVRTATCAAMIVNAINGDVNSFRTILETAGEKPVEKKEIEFKEQKEALTSIKEQLNERAKELIDEDDSEDEE